MSNISQKHYNISVHGLVQGVFYRASAKQMADLLGVKGFVRNQPNGDVYLEAEGDEVMLVKYTQWCHHGPDRAVVKHVSIQEGAVQGFEKFEVIR